MNVAAVVGLLCVVGMLLLSMLLGASVMLYIDLRALLIGPTATLMLLIATFGCKTVSAALVAGFRAIFLVSESTPDSEPMRRVKMVAIAGIQYATVTGFLGAIIGLVIMFQSAYDRSAIGPALAGAILSCVYSAVLVMLIFYPMVRQSTQQMDALKMKR